MFCAFDGSKTPDSSANSQLFILLYAINFFLDALDGYLARTLNQTSAFGAALDMILDRCGTALLFISLLIKTKNTLWLVPMHLDIASHWLLTLSSRANHKIQTHPILKWYYSNLLLICVFHEIFLLVLLSPLTGSIKTLLLICLFPGFASKFLVNIVQLIEASKMLAKPEFVKIS